MVSAGSKIQPCPAKLLSQFRGHFRNPTYTLFPAPERTVLVWVDGLIETGDHVAGATLTFGTAPPNGGAIVAWADGNPILFGSGEPYTIALLILWTEDPGNEGIFRSGSANTGNWLWMLSGGKLWGRQANVNSPASGSGPLITAGWHTLARVWDGQEVRQYVDGLRTNTTAVTATGSWPLYRFGYQFTGSEALDEAYVPFFGAFGAAWDDAMVARWSANPLGMLWPEMDAAFAASGGGSASTSGRRPVVMIAVG